MKYKIYNKKKITGNRGISLLLTLLIMTVLLAIALGVSRLSLGEIKSVRNVSRSLVAYYAAEAGIERAIYEKRIGGGASDIADCSVELSNGSSYGVQVLANAIESVGCYKDIRRAIEVSF